MNAAYEPDAEPTPDDLDPSTWRPVPRHTRCTGCAGHGYTGEPLSLSTRHDTTEARPLCDGTGWEP